MVEEAGAPEPLPEPKAEDWYAALLRLERRLDPLIVAVEQAAASSGSALIHGVEHEAARVAPAWRRVTEGEMRWPVSLVIAAMIALQLSLPADLTLTGNWVLPGIEAVLGVLLLISNPRRVSRSSPGLRVVSLLLIATASLANGWSAVQLILGIVHGSSSSAGSAGAVGSSAVALLVTAGNIWLTNVIVFGLWYWELDRGGPAARAMGRNVKPDFLFPEMTAPELAAEHWEPVFIDYLFVAFTNSTAFSPTDTLPFSRWSKVAMMLQATISVATGLLVVARAVNILPA